MIRPYGGGTDEAQFGTIRQQGRIDPGDGAHQEDIGILQILRLHLPPWQGDDLTEFGKQLHGVGHILINDYFHRALFGQYRQRAPF
ncbi:hypothetical protein VAWG006_23290 [Aeromonas enteropelogenes]|nr:hypothetical protein VAWG006_23290 [Aeromonas enteropelogenes]BEE22238.1 hypothetical protein VAWG007_23330 [Aeromonas enteropelogenes]